MQLKEQWFEPCNGFIRAEYVNVLTGERIPVVEKKNIIVYRAADIIARILAGDRTYIPKYIGYIYAPNTETMTNPATVGRGHTWTDDSIKGAIAGVGGNVILSALGSNPLFGVDGDSGNYEGNVVTLSALSDANAALLLSGSIQGVGTYKTSGPEAGNDKYFQAVLLSEVYQAGSNTPTYIPYAYTQFTDTDEGIDVQAGLELAVYWTFSFK